MTSSQQLTQAFTAVLERYNQILSSLDTKIGNLQFLSVVSICLSIFTLICLFKFYRNFRG